MLKTYLQLIMKIPLSFLNDAVHIWHNYCLWCVDYNLVPNHCYDLVVKGQRQIYFKSVLQLVTQSLLSLRVSMFSKIIAYGMLLTTKFQITAMTLCSKVDVKILKLSFIACNANSSFIFLRESVHI